MGFMHLYILDVRDARASLRVVLVQDHYLQGLVLLVKDIQPGILLM